MSEYTREMSLEEIVEITTMAEKTLKNMSTVLNAVNKNLTYRMLVDKSHGKWIKEYNGDGWNDYSDYKCSNCGKVYERASAILYDANFCPNCGKKMEKVNEK